MEWKYTSAASYGLKDEDLYEAWTEAMVEGRTGVFGIEFSSGHRWIILSEADYLEQQNGS